MSARKFLAWTIGALIALALVGVVVISIVWPGVFAKPYSVVATASGSYVGRLYDQPFSPFVVLKNAYIFTNVTDKDQKTQTLLTPLSQGFLWGSDSISLSRNQVLFKSLVASCSVIDVTLHPVNSCPKPQPAQPSANPPAGQTAPKK